MCLMSHIMSHMGQYMYYIISRRRSPSGGDSHNQTDFATYRLNQPLGTVLKELRVKSGLVTLLTL